MNSLVESLGYLGLFIVAVLSFTIFPGPSDASVVGMIAYGFSPLWVIVIASLGGIVGRVINYRMGSLGEEYVVRKKGWLKPKQVELSKKLFHRYGTAVLLFTWIPFIDDPLTVVAGFYRYPFVRYMIYTSIAVFIRHIGLYLIYGLFT